MAEVKDLLGLALRGVEPRHDDLEAVLRLAGRYRRGRRLVAATVALALTIGLAAARVEPARARDPEARSSRWLR